MRESLPSSLKIKPQLVFAMGGAAFYVFIHTALRWLMEFKFPGGYWVAPAQYENLYPYVFAREIAENGHSWFFKNPFQWDSGERRLFHLYSWLLSWFLPVWNSQLVTFELALGAVFSALLCGQLRSMMPERTRWPFVLLFLVGGGLGSVSLLFSNLSENYKGVFYGLQPGVFFLTSTTWILCEFLLLRTIHQLEKNQMLPAAAVMLFLALLHPIFGLLAAALVFFSLLKKGKSAWRGHRTAIVLCTLAVFYLGPLSIWILPQWSADARYFLELYRNPELDSMFRLEAATLFLFSGGPLLFAALLLLQNFRRIHWREFFDQNQVLLQFLLLLLAVFVLSIGGNQIIPQPGRWFLANLHWLGLLLLARSLGSQMAIIRGPLMLTLGLLALIDGISVLHSSFQMVTRKPQSFHYLGPEEYGFQNYLRGIKPGKIAVFRPCTRESLAAVGSFEYLLMATTPQKAFVSHQYFTPEFSGKAQVFLDCGDPAFKYYSDQVFAAADYVLLPRLSKLDPSRWGFELAHVGKFATGWNFYTKAAL